jgi:hypothetical protein
MCGRDVFCQESKVDTLLGSTLTFRIRQSSDSTWARLCRVTKTYPFHYQTYFGNVSKKGRIGIVEISPFKNEAERTTKIFLSVFDTDSSSVTIIVYKDVYHYKTEWAWSLHNILGLFDFVKVAVSEPSDTPFTKDQLKEISKIIAYVSRKD